ncbi:hypothetical protein F5Y13DRAFT_149116 [Hypoxylon sp. FL1857]|nr:hypothetical protein F5Y13DRAFT_149116 [Hypoxylon sp. FL1857]
MADPLSILGAAVGVTSLIIQMADECIKGCLTSFPRNAILTYNRVQVLYRGKEYARNIQLPTRAPSDGTAAVLEFWARSWYSVRRWYTLRHPSCPSSFTCGHSCRDQDVARELYISKWKI